MGDIKIPEWKPLDLTGFGDIPQLYLAAQKTRADIDAKKSEAETQRRYAANQDRKLSHDITRQTWEDQRALEKEKYDRDIAATNAMPELMRQAATNPQLANVMGAPYGAQFDAQTDAAPSIASKSNPLFAAMFPKGAAEHALAGQTTQAPQAAPSPPDPWQAFAALDRGDEAPAAPTREELDHPVEQPPAQVSGAVDYSANPDVEALTSQVATQPKTTHVYATFRGQRFPVEQADEHPFGEPEYDAMYNRLMKEPGAKSEHILQRISALRGQNLGAAGRTATAGEIHRHNVEEEGLGGQRIEQSDVNSRRAANAKIEAARLISAGMGEKTAVSLMGQYRQYSDSAQRDALFKQIEQTKTVMDKIRSELDPNNPNPITDQMAQHSMAALSVALGGGNGGRVPVSVINDIRHAYNIRVQGSNLVNRLNPFGDGGLSEEARTYLRRAAGTMDTVQQQQQESAFRAWDSRAGLNSPWGFNPATRGFVMAERPFVREILGLAPDQPNIGPALDEGGGGGPPAPRRHRPAGRPAAPPAAGPAGPAGPPTDPLRAKAQHALDNPNAPPEAKAAALKLFPDLKPSRPQ